MSDENPKKRRRQKMTRREAMHAKRALPPEIDPCPVGGTGGQYKPLTDHQIHQIYQSSLRILSELGIGDAPEAMVEQAVKCGATINDAG